MIQGDVNWFGIWLFGVGVAGIIARISVGLTRRIFFRMRIARFRRRYAGPFVLFSWLNNPELVKRLGAPPQGEEKT